MYKIRLYVLKQVVLGLGLHLSAQTWSTDERIWSRMVAKEKKSIIFFIAGVISKQNEWGICKMLLCVSRSLGIAAQIGGVPEEHACSTPRTARLLRAFSTCSLASICKSNHTCDGPSSWGTAGGWTLPLEMHSRVYTMVYTRVLNNSIHTCTQQ